MHTDTKSAMPCGCDEGAKHYCEWHRNEKIELVKRLTENATIAIAEQSDAALDRRFEADPAWSHLATIHDSGQRMTFSSGSMRDPSTGKIDWTRITYGPMMRRWAQHLTTAEAKYPDAAPGVPNFMLVSTREELIRYKKSAMRHFMSWFYDEMDEDHASAVYFNINGVEIIKDKQREKRMHEDQ